MTVNGYYLLLIFVIIFVCIIGDCCDKHFVEFQDKMDRELG